MVFAWFRYNSGSRCSPESIWLLGWMVRKFIIVNKTHKSNPFDYKIMSNFFFFLFFYCLYRFLEPIVFGDYPFIMKALVRDGLPEFTDDEKTLIKGSFDFIGINYYTSRYATAVAFDKDATFSAYSDYQFAKVSGKLLWFHLQNSLI